MKKPTVPASQQGQLDNLCGIYSLVNAVAYLYDGRIKRRKLKLALVNAFSEKWRLEDLFSRGLDDEQMDYLIERVFRHGYYHDHYPVKVTKPFKRKLPGIAEVIQIMERYLKRASPPFTRLIMIAGNDHWTLVRAIDDECFHFFDSYGYKTAFRSSYSTGRGRGRHKLYASYIYFMEREI